VGVTDVTHLRCVSRHVTLPRYATVTFRDKCHALSRSVTLLLLVRLAAVAGFGDNGDSARPARPTSARRFRRRRVE
jgi:hypothetical protein